MSRLNRGEIEALIRSRGFELTSRTGDGFSASYVKTVVDDVSEQSAVIHCTVAFGTGQCVLLAYPDSGFELKTSWFFVDDPNYQTWFEDKLAAMAMTLKEVYG